MAKKILFPIIAIFLGYRAYEIIHTLWITEPAEFNLSLKIILSVLLNLFLTGIFAFVGFAYSTNKLLPEEYYCIDNPKLILKLSKFLKIEYFKKFLLFMFWGKKKNREKYFDGTKLGIENLDYQTRQSEFGHMAALIIIQIVVVLLLIKGHFLMAFFTTLINFFSNFYPVLLQRNHRIQIERINKVLKRSFKKQPSVNL